MPCGENRMASSLSGVFHTPILPVLSMDVRAVWEASDVIWTPLFLFSGDKIGCSPLLHEDFPHKRGLFSWKNFTKFRASVCWVRRTIEPALFLRFRTDQGWKPREERYMRKPSRPLARRIDERQPAPYQQRSPEPVFCNEHERCQGCPYPRHGIVCWHRDGTCLRTDMEEIGRRQKNDSSSFK